MTRASPPPRIPGLLVFALWVGAEILVFNLVAAAVGGGMAFFLLVMKSVLGLVFVKRAIVRTLLDLMRRRGAVVLEGAAMTDAWMKALGGALLAAPGFVTGLAGLALLTPSVRHWLARRSRGGRLANPREIELGSQEWREVPRRPPHSIGPE
jgi:UPF0716 protein FxsA